MKKFKLILIFVVVASVTLNAQKKRAAHWFFGYEAGIDFNSGVAVADTTGNLISIEGSAVISDTLGNLLFYSNGQKVWDKNGNIMANSIGLNGDHSAAQSCIVIPRPGNSSHYYLFSTFSGLVNSGFYFSIVDMNLNGGLGDINSTKNVFLLNSASEELAATRHCNGIDYWVVTRQVLLDTLKFSAYHISSAGVATPIVSTIPTLMPANPVGGLTFSQDGSKLIHSTLGSAQIHVLIFNKQTGSLTLQTSITANAGEQVYSNALSPDASKLYITSWSWMPGVGICYLAQFDLLAVNINASRVNIGSVDFSNGSPTSYGYLGQLRLAPDQKIYLSRYNFDALPIPNSGGYSLDSLDVINAPNQLGTLCNYQQNAIYLNQKPTQIGLPNFVSNFTSDQAIVNTCPTTTVSIDSQPQQDFQLEIYPNPFSDKTNLVFSNGYHPRISISVTDVLGKTYFPIVTSNSEVLLLEKGNLHAGIYYLTVWDDKKPVAQKKLIVL